MKITDEQIQWFKEADITIKKGFYPNGQKAIDEYKKIFAEEIAEGKMTNSLNPKCGSCIRTSVQKVIEKINELEKLINEQSVEKENQGT